MVVLYRCGDDGSGPRLSQGSSITLVLLKRGAFVSFKMDFDDNKMSVMS